MKIKSTNIKRIISMLLTIAIMLTCILPAMAEGTGSAEKELEGVIKSVKQRITIPEDCNKFTYNINNQNDMTRWNLTWRNEEKQKYISIDIDKDGFISSYYSSQNTISYDKKIPKYSKEEGKKFAEAFINKLDPKLLPQYKLINDNLYSNAPEYNYNYTRQVNGISYERNGISIQVKKYTGAVIGYYCDYSKNTSFEDASKIIGIEEAKKAFIEKLGLKLVYNTKIVDGKTVSYLAYIPKDSNKYIDAITGGVEKLNNILYIRFSEKSSMSAAYSLDTKEEVKLTPEEMEAVQNMSNIISKEDADKRIRGIKYVGLDSEFKLSNSRLNKDWRNKEKFTWTLSYSKLINSDTNYSREINVSIDAESGEVISFNTYYNSAEGTKPQKTEEQAKAICDEAVKDLFASKYSNLKFDATFANNSEDLSQFAFRYVRVQNGLECPNDNINIAYDNLSGNIVSINCNWTKDLSFDDPKKAIAIEKAYEVLFDKIGFDIKYLEDNTKNTNEKIIINKSEAERAVLGYVINANKPNIISGLTGEVLNNMGEVYKETTISDYSDIKGLSSENKIKILTQMSIKYRENELKPNDSLLQKDYLYILCQLNDVYFAEQTMDDKKVIESMYDTLIKSGIIDKSEKAPSSTVTREEAAKYFIKFLKLGHIAELKNIYKADFKDSNKIDKKLIGYVCLTSGLKAMNGDKGYFRPKNKLTRQEGLLLIYSYLTNKQ